jgi:hypothetical protein
VNCPYCGLAAPRLAQRCPHCGVGYSPETRANRKRGRDFHSGFFFPLYAEQALSHVTGPGYVEECAERARREPASARNVIADKTVRERKRRLQAQSAGRRR